ncbi:MAG: cadherin-like beta sandwich domain-containing protein, partial [Syntrophomonadaceae bacterium]|nr:cadherin-like beta sandwich domain-containing protein [Syntrophomonadaceae bacterium]
YNDGYMDGYLNYSFKGNTGSDRYDASYSDGYDDSQYDLGFNNGFWAYQSDVPFPESLVESTYEAGYYDGYYLSECGYNGNSNTNNFGSGYIQGRADSTDYQPYGGASGNRPYQDGYRVGYIAAGGDYPLNGEARLSSLTLMGIGDEEPVELLTLTTSDSIETEYTIDVENMVGQVALSFDLLDASATVKVYCNNALVNNPINLNLGSNVIEIVVTAADGYSTETYTLNVNRDPGTGVTGSTNISTCPQVGSAEAACLQVTDGGTSPGYIHLSVYDNYIGDTVMKEVYIDEGVQGSSASVASCIYDEISNDSIITGYYNVCATYYNGYYIGLLALENAFRNLSVEYADDVDLPTGINMSISCEAGTPDVLQVNELTITNGATLSDGTIRLVFDDGVLDPDSTMVEVVLQNDDSAAAAVAQKIYTAFAGLSLPDYTLEYTDSETVRFVRTGADETPREFRIIMNNSFIPSSCTDISNAFDIVPNTTNNIIIGYSSTPPAVSEVINDITAIDGSSPTIVILDSNGNSKAYDEVIADGDKLQVTSEDGSATTEYVLSVRQWC